MNLSAYDSVENKFTEGTWINPKFKRLYSTELEYHPYCIFLEKFNIETGEHNFYIALTNTIPKNQIIHNVIYTKHKVLKINLDAIWNKLNIKDAKDKFYVDYHIDDKTDEGIIYFVDI